MDCMNITVIIANFNNKFAFVHLINKEVKYHFKCWENLLQLIITKKIMTALVIIAIFIEIVVQN